MLYDIEARVVPFQRFFGLTKANDVCVWREACWFFRGHVILQKALELWEDQSQPLWKRFVFGLISLYFSV